MSGSEKKISEKGGIKGEDISAQFAEVTLVRNTDDLKADTRTVPLADVDEGDMVDDILNDNTPTVKLENDDEEAETAETDMDEDEEVFEENNDKKSKTKSELEAEAKKNKKIKYIAIGIFSFIFLVIAVAGVYIIMKKGSKKAAVQQASPVSVQGQSNGQFQSFNNGYNLVNNQGIPGIRKLNGYNVRDELVSKTDMGEAITEALSTIKRQQDEHNKELETHKNNMLGIFKAQAKERSLLALHVKSLSGSLQGIQKDMDSLRAEKAVLQKVIATAKKRENVKLMETRAAEAMIIKDITLVGIISGSAYINTPTGKMHDLQEGSPIPETAYIIKRIVPEESKVIMQGGFILQK